jgi:hypothetical protein
MPRLARLDTPDRLHHVMIRGIERHKIFNDDQDRENLIERLSILLPATRVALSAIRISNRFTIVPFLPQFKLSYLYDMGFA